MTSQVLVAAGWVVGWLLLWRVPSLPRPRADRSDGAPAGVSIVVPARDEAHNLVVLLASIERQTVPPAQVIVVDDHSSDSTAAVARSFAGVQVVPAPGLPEGWTGKTWACWTGANKAAATRLLFLDADVELHPEAIAALVEQHKAVGGLLSVLPLHRTRTPIEWASMPFNVIAAMGLGIGSVVPPSRMRAAAGPCVVCHTADYHEIDGHRAVRGEVVEDLALGQLFARHQHPVTLLGGGRLVAFRMYRSLRALVVGWSKNIATGARLTSSARTAGVVLWIAAASTVAGALVVGVAGGEVARPAVAAYLAFAIQFACLGRGVGRFGPAAVLWPAWLAGFLAIFAWSAVATALLGWVTWSGRHISTRRTRISAP